MPGSFTLVSFIQILLPFFLLRRKTPTKRFGSRRFHSVSPYPTSFTSWSRLTLICISSVLTALNANTGYRSHMSISPKNTTIWLRTRTSVKLRSRRVTLKMKSASYNKNLATHTSSTLIPRTAKILSTVKLWWVTCAQKWCKCKPHH